MHTGQDGGLGRRQPLDHPRRVLRMRVVVQLVPKSLARFEDVGLRNRRMVSARLGEQITAQQRARSLFDQEPAFPSVREMRHIEPANPMTTKGNDFGVADGPWFAVGYVRDRNHRSYMPAKGKRLGCYGEELV